MYYRRVDATSGDHAIDATIAYESRMDTWISARLPALLKIITRGCDVMNLKNIYYTA